MELEHEVWCPGCKALVKQVDAYTAKGGPWQKGYVYQCGVCGSLLHALTNRKPQHLQSQAEQARLYAQKTAYLAKSFAREHTLEELAPTFAEALVSLTVHVVQDIYRCPACSSVRQPYEQVNGQWQRIAWNKAVEIALEPGWPAAACRTCQALWILEQKPVQASLFAS